MNLGSLFRQIRYFCLVCLTLVTLTPVGTALSASAELAWEPNGSPAEGYLVFVRRTDQAYNYAQPDWEGAATTCIIDNLQDETEYHFVLRAYNGDQVSPDSNEVHYIPEALDESGDNSVATEDDADGLPNEWATESDPDPLTDDANTDDDQDGIDNHDEFLAGLDPDDPGVGTAPLSPALIEPISEVIVSTSSLLEVGDYWDLEGDAHIATQWQIFDALTDKCLLDVISDRRLNQMQVPMLLLDGGSAYQWRARFFDSGGKASAWSVLGGFSTEAAENDLNGNGIPDDYEYNQTTADIGHAMVTPDAGLASMVLDIDADDSIAVIEQLVFIDPESLEVDDTTPARLPATMIAFKLVLYESGQQVQVTIHLSDTAPEGAAWFKFDTVNGWQDYSEYVRFDEDHQKLTVRLQDGGYGDADGVANGVILDPSGLVVAEETHSTDDTTENTDSDSGTVTNSSGGGGCFINALQR